MVKRFIGVILILTCVFGLFGCAIFQNDDGTINQNKVDALASLSARSAGRTLGLLRPEFIPVARAYIDKMQEMSEMNYRMAFIKGLSTIMSLKGVTASVALLNDAKDLLTLFGYDINLIDEIDENIVGQIALDSIKAIVKGFNEGLMEAELYNQVT